MKKLIVWLVALSAIAGGGYVAWRKYPDKIAFWRSADTDSAKKPGPPTTAVVGIRDISFAVTGAGDIGPVDTVSVRPEVGGLIAKLTLDLGDKVKKGDVLFTLNDYDLQTEKSSRKMDIAGANLAVETSRIQLEKSDLSFRRVSELFKSKLVSQEAFDNARINYELARNSLDLATNHLEAAQTALQQVEDKLVKTVIRAPFDCTILTRPVSVGQAVSGSDGFSGGTEVFTVANLADMVITAHVNQAEVTRLNVNQTVTVQVEAVPGLKLEGKVDRIAPQATIKNGVKGFDTRIILRNADEVVRPGMTANISIPLASADKVPAIPLAAVFTEQDERFVYVQKDGDKFERQPIQIGVSDYEFAEVTKGLKGGEVVSLVVPPSASNPGTQNPGNKSGRTGTPVAAGKPAVGAAPARGLKGAETAKTASK